MAYEDLRLVVAALSGEIYLARINKNGYMSNSRREITEDCLRATTEWFIANKKKMITYDHESKDKRPSLFYTDDAIKVEKILKILQEEVK